ncbi:MAG: hypothetical protein HKN92_00665 [Chitinophagales bacterium]|nr:hypothetical protein [Chitinophagales bacterium]
MRQLFSILMMTIILSMASPLMSDISAQDDKAEQKTEVVTVYEYKEHPITPNDYLFRTVFWGACFVVVVTVIALLRTMVRMEELRER